MHSTFGFFATQNFVFGIAINLKALKLHRKLNHRLRTLPNLWSHQGAHTATDIARGRGYVLIPNFPFFWYIVSAGKEHRHLTLFCIFYPFSASFTFFFGGCHFFLAGFVLVLVVFGKMYQHFGEFQFVFGSMYQHFIKMYQHSGKMHQHPDRVYQYPRGQIDL